MERSQLAATLIRLANNDKLNDVGRLILSEVKRDFNVATMQDLRELLKEFYPFYVYEEHGNVLRILFSQNERETHVSFVRIPCSDE